MPSDSKPAAELPRLRDPAPVVTVPVEPTSALLHSMAVRYDHGLGMPGYYDQPIFGAENVGHARRLEATISVMRQLHEEVVGTGFYRPAEPVREAEPVAKRWLVEEHLPSGSTRWSCYEHERMARDEADALKNPTTVTPLYASPTDAAEIERLKRDYDGLLTTWAESRARHLAAEARVASLEAELARVREALEPFAQIADSISASSGVPERDISDDTYVTTRLGECRRARVALANRGQEEGR